MKKSILFFAIAGILFLQSCVPAKKLEDVQTLNSKLLAQNESLTQQANDAKAKSDEVMKSVNTLQEQVNKLISDTTYYGERYRKIEALNDHLNELYEKVIQQNQQLLNNSTTDKIALNDSLKKKQQDLFQQEMKLHDLQKDLDLREQKLKELQSLLNQKDSATNALKEKISNALLGFENGDLTVEQRDGKIYVSMAEKLLFKSGSTAVDDRGKQALQQLAAVLKKNSDIAVTVEGHTDNVPLSGTGSMKDNWDLSVLRATSITRILTDAGVDPKQITSAGRGEFFPVASNESADGRSKNRRTEIILSPKLDELMKLLQK